MLKTALPLLAALAAPLAAQSPAPQGGGEVSIAGATYRFEPESLMASTAPVEGQRALRLRGRLVPAGGGAAWTFELVTLGPREIYLMNLVQRDGTVEKARWSATLKTQVEVVAPEHPGDGDHATYKVQGPLVGSGKGKRTAWTGSFWCGFTVEQVP